MKKLLAVLALSLSFIGYSFAQDFLFDVDVTIPLWNESVSKSPFMSGIGASLEIKDCFNENWGLSWGAQIDLPKNKREEFEDFFVLDAYFGVPYKLIDFNDDFYIFVSGQVGVNYICPTVKGAPRAIDNSFSLWAGGAVDLYLDISTTGDLLINAGCQFEYNFIHFIPYSPSSGVSNYWKCSPKFGATFVF